MAGQHTEPEWWPQDGRQPPTPLPAVLQSQEGAW